MEKTDGFEDKARKENTKIGCSTGKFYPDFFLTSFSQRSFPSHPNEKVPIPLLNKEVNP